MMAARARACVWFSCASKQMRRLGFRCYACPTYQTCGHSDFNGQQRSAESSRFEPRCSLVKRTVQHRDGVWVWVCMLHSAIELIRCSSHAGDTPKPHYTTPHECAASSSSSSATESASAPASSPSFRCAMCVDLLLIQPVDGTNDRPTDRKPSQPAAIFASKSAQRRLYPSVYACDCMMDKVVVMMPTCTWTSASVWSKSASCPSSCRPLKKP